MVWALVAIAALVAWLVLSFRDGEGRLVRGRAPARLRMDFIDALRSMKGLVGAGSSRRPGWITWGVAAVAR